MCERVQIGLDEVWWRSRCWIMRSRVQMELDKVWWKLKVQRCVEGFRQDWINLNKAWWRFKRWIMRKRV